MFKTVIVQLHQMVVAFDQFLNTCIPGGMADETLSARAHRMREKKQKYWGWTANAIDLLFFWQKDEQGNRNHCKTSYESEVNRSQLPKHYQK